MRRIILDTGPVITLALNNLLWLLKEVKTKYKMSFCITEPVKKELIDNPLTTKKFKFGALQVLKLLENGVLDLITEKNSNEKTQYLLQLANTSYKTKHRFLDLVHYAEMSAVSAAIAYKADAVMIDERTTRYIIERPKKLQHVLSHKLHTKVGMNRSSLAKLRIATKPIKFIRSAEFVTVAFEKGLLNDFLPHISEPRKNLLDALLWGLKLNGCAISHKDLTALLRIELK